MREGCITDLDEKEPLISHDVLSVRQLKNELALPCLETNTCDLDASLFLKFSYCGLFKRFSFLHSSPWGSPVVLASKRALRVNEAKKDAPCSIKNQQPGRGSATYCRMLLVRHRV